MAFNAKAVLIVRTGGSDANGGGFNAGNANFATDLAATSGTTAAPVVTSASYNFVAGDVGARVFIQSGTNWIAGWYTIASVAANAATLTASVGNATLYDGTQASGTSTATGCATTGSPTGGVWGLDYTNQDAARFSMTDMIIDATTNTNFTSVLKPVGKNYIGNYINVTSGTGFTVQRVEVVSTSTITATCDKSLGTLASTGGNGALGGALASPGSAASFAVGGNDIFLASGTYTLGSSTQNIATGRVNINFAGTAPNPGVFEGFGTIPKDMGTAPVISAGAIATTVVTIASAFNSMKNITVDCNATSTIGINISGSDAIVDQCTVKNAITTCGLQVGSASGLAIRCVVTGCAGSLGAIGLITTGATVMFCESYSNTTTGIYIDAAVQGAKIIGCLSYANSGGTSDGIGGGAATRFVIVMNCIAYNNGRHGYFLSNGILINSLAEGHAAGYGFAGSAASSAIQLLNCGGYNNASGNVDGTTILTPTVGFVTNTTGSFFTNPGSADFSLNNTTNQGKLARGTGFPGAYPRGLTTGYIDIGAAQSQATSGPVGGVLVIGTSVARASRF